MIKTPYILRSHYMSGNLSGEAWYRDGDSSVYQRNDGPAQIYYYETGQVESVFWYFNNHVCSLEEYCVHTDNDPLLMKTMYT